MENIRILLISSFGTLNIEIIFKRKSPKTIKKEIKEILERTHNVGDSKKALKVDIKHILKHQKTKEKQIAQITILMDEYADKLLFVEAAICRDAILKLEKKKDLPKTPKKTEKPKKL